MATESVDKFYNWLIDNGIKDQVAEICRAQQIDEEIASDITEPELLAIGILLGDAKRLVKLIKSLKTTAEEDKWIPQDTSDVASSSHQHDLHFIHDNEILQSTQRQDTQSPMLAQPQPINVPESFQLPENVRVIQVVQMPRASQQNVPAVGSTYCEETDLMEVIRRSPDKPHKGTLIEALNMGKKLANEQMNLFVDIVVRDLVTQCGEYPSTRCKEALAKRITDSFPQLGQPYNEEHKPYVMFFHRVEQDNKMRNRGKIEGKLAKLASKLPIEKRKKAQRTQKPAQLEFAASNVDMALVSLVPSDINKSQIRNFIDSTFNDRQNMRNNKQSAAQIIEKYPTIIDYNGEMIDLEFKKMDRHAITNIGESQFYGLTTKLVELSTKVDLSTIKVLLLKSLLVMVDSLPLKQRKRCPASTTDVVEAMISPLIKFVEPEADIQQFVIDHKQRQPYMITTHKLHEDEMPGGKYFVVVDEWFVTSSGLLRALETLYKAHWVFNLEYVKEMSVVYNFLDVFIFKERKAVPKAACCALYDKIKVV